MSPRKQRIPGSGGGGGGNLRREGKIAFNNQVSSDPTAEGDRRDSRGHQASKWLTVMCNGEQLPLHPLYLCVVYSTLPSSARHNA